MIEIDELALGLLLARRDQRSAKHHKARHVANRLRIVLPSPDRFWSRVLVTDGCWEWQGNRNPNGYGMTDQCGREYAHRRAYRLAKGPIPASDADGRRLVVMHTCDNPACCNPSHLTLGTHAENTQDAIQKGRFRRNARLRKPSSSI